MLLLGQKEKRLIVSPLRGFYIIVPPEYEFSGCIPDYQIPPILFGHLKCDYYVGLLSAGLFNGASHQKPNKFQIVTEKDLKTTY